MVTGNVLAWIIKQIDPRISNASAAANAALARCVSLENRLNALTKVTSLNGLSNVVTLSAGSNITLTPDGQDIEISASGGGGGGMTLVTSGTFTFNFNNGGSGTTYTPGQRVDYNINDIKGSGFTSRQAGDVTLLYAVTNEATRSAANNKLIPYGFCDIFENLDAQPTLPDVSVIFRGCPNPADATPLAIYNGNITMYYVVLRP